jgi:hypothetical protein
VRAAPAPLEGGCSCGQVRYRIPARPMIVNACHCRRCERETGAAFVIDALVERDRLSVGKGRTVQPHAGAMPA